jgi:hypothetical protein
MTYIIFDLFIRDGACIDVCSVECIVPGIPEEELPAEQLYTMELKARYFSEGSGYTALESL